MGDGDRRLEVEFIDEVRIVLPGSTLSFGRQGDLVIDDANPFLHRIVGEFLFVSGAWRLSNRGTRILIHLIAENGSRMEIVSGGIIPVPLGTTRVLFEAGSARYEIRIRQASLDLGASVGILPVGESTTDWGTIPLNYEQRRLLVALCEIGLIEPMLRVPSNKLLASRLGWSVKKVERKFDYLCQRYADTGVVGLRGCAGEDALDRRRRLAEHVLRHKIVTADDLVILDVKGLAPPRT